MDKIKLTKIIENSGNGYEVIKKSNQITFEMDLRVNYHAPKGTWLATPL